MSLAGIRSRVAVIIPPLIDPTYMPMRRVRAYCASIPYVSGMVSAMSIVPVRPGIAPTKIPSIVPSATSSNPPGLQSCVIAC